MSIIAIIPCLNRRKYTEGIVKDLQKMRDLVPKIILADSGSTDGTLDLEDSYNNVAIIHCGQAAWWADAVAMAVDNINLQDIDNVLILNDDIKLERNLLLSLLRVQYAKKFTGIVCPAQIPETGEYFGTNYSKLFKLPRYVKGCIADAPRVVDVVNGCCMLIPSTTLKILPKFNSFNIPHAGADFAFQLTAARLGYPVLCVNDNLLHTLDTTNYTRGFKLREVFSSNKSVVNVKMYCNFGRVLFGSGIRFAILGWYHHLRYLYNLFRVIF